MGSTVKWAQMKDSAYSGPQVFGACPYVLPPNPTGFDVIVAAVAKPEGGDYDTVVMYDGTAVTYGLLQWTFTSGRLHKLLAATEYAMGSAAYNKLMGLPLSDLTGLSVLGGDLLHGDKKVTDYFSLRGVCTPPGGAVPKVGKNWELAKKIALLFSKLGENPTAQKVQLSFFTDELVREVQLKRPKLGGARIADYLPPAAWAQPPTGYSVSQPVSIAAQALFWGMWQNAPRKAEEYLDKAARGVFMPLRTQAHLERLAKQYAYTNYARWGVEKAKKAVDKDGKPKPYASRYQKVASEINRVMGQKIVPEYWR
jgi:hypothetical protein